MKWIRGLKCRLPRGQQPALSIGGSERQQWLGRVRGPDGRQRWVKAADLRQAKVP